MQQWVEIAIGMLFGSVFGSFATVVAARVPRGASIVQPRSHCTACETTLSALDLVPVISWVLRGGKCAHCKVRIPIRYPMIEMVSAIAFGAIVWRFGLTGRSAVLCGISVGLIALSAIDLETFKLPNRVLYPLTIGAVAGIVIANSVAGDPFLWLVRALGGGMLAFATFFLLHLAVPRGMGFGDVRLSFLLGFSLAWISWGALLIGFFSAFLIGGLIGSILMLAKRAKGKTALPFGPMLAAGWWLGVLWGTRLANSYFELAS